MKIRITNSCDGKWYKVGEIYETISNNKYPEIGIKVRTNFENQNRPYIVAHGDYEYIGN